MPGFVSQDAPLSPKQARLLNPIQLAFAGDTVFDLYVRTHLLLHEQVQVKYLHRRAVAQVNCSAQAQALKYIEPILTPEEADVCRRGRNAHSRPPRNADPAEYARATGLEALLGYLYLSGQEERLKELMSVLLSQSGDNAKEVELNA